MALEFKRWFEIQRSEVWPPVVKAGHKSYTYHYCHMCPTDLALILMQPKYGGLKVDTQQIEPCSRNKHNSDCYEIIVYGINK